MAAQMKFITGLLILLMFSARISISLHDADALQDGDGDVEIATFSDEGTATTATKQQIRGRKMSPVVKEKEKESIAGSHEFAGKCEEKEKANANHCKKSVSRRFYGDVDYKGFVAFNADYHEPRHHPPKNN